MFIREIRINGFTSYLSDTTVKDINPGLNVVVGRNGAGKSNFFAAIQFVLADLTGKTNQDLLFNGRGRRAESSLVEIVLADAGAHFLTLGDTVTIGRQIQRGNDRYLVNGKATTKAETRALLDAAGLSFGGNAFFIVPQGDVTKLASASDTSRLDTLLAASGAKTFEDRRQAALKVLKGADGKLEECSELLTSMERHLAQVGQDAEHLKEHLELRKQLRAIEHTLITIERIRTKFVVASEDQKFEEQRERLDRANAQLRDYELQQATARNDLANAEAKLAEAEAELSMAEHEADTRRKEAKAASNLANAVRTDHFGGIDQSLTLNYSRNTLSAGESVMDVDGEDVAEDGEESEEEEEELPSDEAIEAHANQLEQTRENLNAKSKELTSLNSRLRALQLKQGRADQLSAADRATSRAEATKLIESRIASLQKSIEQETRRKTELEQSCAAAEENITKCEQKSNEASEEVAAATANQQLAGEQLAEAESARSMALLAFRKAEISRERLEKLADQQTKQLLATSRPSVVCGIQGIRELAKSLNLSPSQYLGTVADLIDIQPSVAYAADRVSGSQMFYHVVDNADTVKRLIEGMEKSDQTSLGSASFIPLADVIVEEPPSLVEAEGTTPLSSMVSVQDSRFEKIVKLLFGRYVLCEDLKRAMEYSREHQLPTVTLEGDLCDPRGAISGGSAGAGSGGEGSNGGVGGGSGSTAFRQGLVRELGQTQDSILAMAEEARTQRVTAEKAAQRVTQCVDQLNKAKVQLLRASIARQDAGVPVVDLRDQITVLSRQIDEANVAISDLESQLAIAEQEKQFTASESSFASSLSAEERQEMAELANTISSLREQCSHLAEEEYSLAVRYRKMVSRRDRRRAAELRHTDNSVASEALRLQEAQAEAEEKRASAQAAAISKRQILDAAQQDVSTAQEKLKLVDEAVARAEHECKTLNRKVENHSVKMRALTGLIKDLETKMDQLGSIPESALRQAEALDANASSLDEQSLKARTKELNAEHRELNRSLKKLGDVNQRAINDFETYSAELESLKKQHASLSNERSTILNTIETLNSQKSEKLDAMLVKVVAKFESIFAALTGSERGSLVLHRDPETAELTSIGLDVSFGKRTNQLSGGQKCLCALALIFAVQACDPASFYVFDEIDANLDQTARKRVSATLKAISEQNGTQFICTTFREELVQAADAWFGVSFNGQESQVCPISKKEAMEFVIQDVPN